jgi:hypothetical protein
MVMIGREAVPQGAADDELLLEAESLAGRRCGSEADASDGAIRPRNGSPDCLPPRATKKKGRIAPRPFKLDLDRPWVKQAGLAALPKLRYFSLPTKPNLVTPEALMMFSTLAERS